MNENCDKMCLVCLARNHLNVLLRKRIIDIDWYHKMYYAYCV